MPLNVCMVTSYFYPKGYGGNAVYALCRNLVKLGLDVDVLTSTIKGEPNRESLDGIQIQRIPTGFLKVFNIQYPFSPTAVNNLLRIVRKTDVNIIHAQFLFSPLSLCAGFYKSINLTSIPLVATSHGLTTGYPSSFVETASKMLSFFSTKLVMENAKAIATVSTNEYNYLKNYFPTKVHNIPNGVDTSKFKPLFQKGFAFRERLAIKEDEVVVLYFAHLRATKGILTLLDAMDIVAKKNPLVKFLIVGTGPLATEVKKRLSKYGDNAYAFIKYIPESELTTFYNACDIYVLPSFVEGMPLSLMEAMACGKPVIATNVADIPIIAKNGINGVIIPPGDAKLLANSILDLVEKDDLRNRMGKANSEKMQNYDWEIIAKKYHSLYLDVLRS
jgi:glycosyltransferase involved in cell wall biosynthesis